MIFAFFCIVVAMIGIALTRNPHYREEENPPIYTYANFLKDMYNPSVSIEDILEKCNGQVPRRHLNTFPSFMVGSQVLVKSDNRIGYIVRGFQYPSRRLLVRFDSGSWGDFHENDLVGR